MLISSKRTTIVESMIATVRNDISRTLDLLKTGLFGLMIAVEQKMLLLRAHSMFNTIQTVLTKLQPIQ